MRSSKYKYKFAKKARGAALVEGVLALFLVIVGSTFGTLLLANVGVVMVYQNKLAFITTQAATKAASQSTPSPESVKPTVDMLLGKIGLPPAHLVGVEVDEPNKAVKVTVTLRNITLVGQGTILPAYLFELKDTEAALTA